MITRLALAIALSSALFGCNSIGPATCARDIGANPAVDYTEGVVKGDVYMTSPWDGELLYFPGGMHYQLEHKLATKPAWVDAYLSFERFGTRSGGIVSAASGNEVEVVGVDEQRITIDNGSCADFWLLVVAGSSGDHPSPP